MAEEREYGVATSIDFPLVTFGSTDGDFSTGVSFAAGDVRLSKDGSTWANATNTPTLIGVNSGIYTLSLTATEMQMARGVLLLIDQTATKVWEDQAVVINTYGSSDGQHAWNRNSTSPGVQVEGIDAGAITAASIAAGAITSTKFAAGAINSTAIATDAITNEKIAADAIGASEIAANAIGASELADNAITAAKIATAAITSTKFGAGALNSTAIASGAFTTDKFTDGHYTQIWSESTRTLTRLGVALTDTDFSAGFITSTKFAAGALNSTAIASGAFTTDKFADGHYTQIWAEGTRTLTSVGTGSISSGSFTTGEMNNLAARVWDEVISAGQHNVNQSGARYLRTLATNGGYERGFVYVDEVAGASTGTVDYEDATVTNRATDFDNAQTIATSVDIDSIHVNSGNSITLTGNINNFTVEGPGASLALGSQTITGAIIRDFQSITGIATSTNNSNRPLIENSVIGTATLPPIQIRESGFTGTVTIGSSGDYEIIDSHSLVAGAGAPVFDLGAASTMITTMSFRRWSGGISFLGLQAGDIISIDAVSGGNVTVEGTGGSLNVRGMVSIVDNSSGVSIVRTNQVNFTGIAAATWDSTRSGHVTAGTFGEGVVVAPGGIGSTAFAAGALNSTAIASGAFTTDKFADGHYTQIWAESTRSLTTLGFTLSSGDFGSGALSTGNIAQGVFDKLADSVWDEASTGHVTIGTFGQTNAGLRAGTAQGGAAGNIRLDSGASTADDFYNNTMIVITAGTGVGQSRIIEDYTGNTTKLATVSPNWVVSPDTLSEFVLLPFDDIPGASAPSAQTVADAVWDTTRSGHSTAGTFGEGVLIASGGIAAAAFAAGAINSTAIASGAFTTDKFTDGHYTQIWAESTRSLTALGFTFSSGDFGAGSLSTGNIAQGVFDKLADSVWDEASTGHVTIGTFGQAQAGMRAGTAQGGAAGNIRLDSGASTADGFYDNVMVVLTGGAGVGQSRIIEAYTGGTTKLATVTPNWVVTPTTLTEFVLLPFDDIPGASAPTAGAVADAVWDEARADHNGAGSFGEGVRVAAGAIGSTQFAAGAINSTAIAADAITAGKIAANSIGASELAAGAITSTHFAAGALNSTAIASGAFTTDKFTDGHYTQIWAESTRTLTRLGMTLTDTDIATGFLTSAKFAAGSITSTAIASGAFTTDVFGDGHYTQIWNEGTRTLTSLPAGIISSGVITTGMVANMVSDIWNRDLAAHNTTGTAGRWLRLSNSVLAEFNVTDTAPTATAFQTDINSTRDDFFNDSIILFVSGTLAGVSRIIADSSGGATPLVTLDEALPLAPTNGDNFILVGSHTHPVQQIANSVWDTSRAGHTTAGTFGEGVLLAAGAIGSTQFAAGAINSTAIATDAIIAEKIGTDAITAAKIAANAIGASELASGAITSTHFAAGAINSTAIATDAITADKIAANSIGASEIADGAIDAGAFAAGAITSTAIASGAFTTDKFTDGHYTQIWAESTRTLTRLGMTLTDTDIASGFLTSAKFAAGSINSTAIASGAFTTDKFTDGHYTQIWSESTRTLTRFGFSLTSTDFAANSLTTTIITQGVFDKLADGVWDELKAAHVSTGSFGEEVQAHALSAEVSALNDISAAEVNAEVLDVLSVDNFAEPVTTTSAPNATETLARKLGYLYAAFANRIDVTTALKVFYTSTGGSAFSKALSDGGSTYTEARVST